MKYLLTSIVKESLFLWYPDDGSGISFDQKASENQEKVLQRNTVAQLRTLMFVLNILQVDKTKPLTPLLKAVTKFNTGDTFCRRKKIMCTMIVTPVLITR